MWPRGGHLWIRDSEMPRRLAARSFIAKFLSVLGKNANGGMVARIVFLCAAKCYNRGTMIKIIKRSAVAALVAAAICAFGVVAHAQVANGIFPSVPGGLTATIVPPAQVSVSWGASSESSGTIEDYRLYRNGLLITTTAGTSFIDAGLLPGVYAYAVASVDANGNASTEASSTSVTLLADTTPPSAPTGVTVAGTTSTKSYYASTTLTISWSASTDNVGVVGYYVYRNGTSLTSGTSTAITGTSITDAVTPGTYSYSVVAYDASQNIWPIRAGHGDGHRGQHSADDSEERRRIPGFGKRRELVVGYVD